MHPYSVTTPLSKLGQICNLLNTFQVFKKGNTGMLEFVLLAQVDYQFVKSRTTQI
jgi:hypothetical protein